MRRPLASRAWSAACSRRRSEAVRPEVRRRAPLTMLSYVLIFVFAVPKADLLQQRCVRDAVAGKLPKYRCSSPGHSAARRAIRCGSIHRAAASTGSIGIPGSLGHRDIVSTRVYDTTGWRWLAAFCPSADGHPISLRLRGAWLIKFSPVRTSMKRSRASGAIMLSENRNRSTLSSASPRRVVGSCSKVFSGVSAVLPLA